MTEGVGRAMLMAGGMETRGTALFSESRSWDCWVVPRPQSCALSLMKSWGRAPGRAHAQARRTAGESGYCRKLGDEPGYCREVMSRVTHMR